MSSLSQREKAVEKRNAGAFAGRLAGLGGQSGIWIVSIAALASIVLANTWSHLYYHNVCDDSLISMQYAKNLALGNGLVFNIGERVEGYTNFLWIVVMAPLYRLCDYLGIDFIFVAVQASILIAAIDLFLIYKVGRHLWHESILPLIVAIGICLVDNSYTVWAMQALESHLVIFWTLVALLVWKQRKQLWLGAALACLAMSRPDALLFVGVLIGNDFIELGVAFWKRSRSKTYRRRVQRFATMLAVFLVLYGSYFFWRYSYYGYLLPNTFYLKMSGLRWEAIERGLIHLKEFLSDRGWIPLVALFSLFWTRNQVVRVVFLWTILHVLYVVYVGGDFYPGHRFFVVIIPSLGLLIGQAVHGVAQPVTRWMINRDDRVKRFIGRTAMFALLSLVAAGLVQMTLLGLERGPYKIEIIQFRERIENVYSFQRWFGRKYPKPASIITGDIGSWGFIAGLTVFDYYGVIDPNVAHKAVSSFGKGKPGHEKRASVNYLMRKDPTYIRLGYVRGDVYRYGYYLDDEGPKGRCGIGIWIKDPLQNSGAWESSGAIPFREADTSTWEATGDMYGSWRAIGTRRHQQSVSGTTDFYLSTFHPRYGDNAVGRIRSTPFPLVGEIMVIRVGGGRDPERLRVSLLVDNTVVYSTTGRDCELLGRRTWDISSYRGKNAILEVVDEVRGPWGHIMVDEVRQWSSR